jgi:hypothetical protein
MSATNWKVGDAVREREGCRKNQVMKIAGFEWSEIMQALPRTSILPIPVRLAPEEWLPKWENTLVGQMPILLDRTADATKRSYRTCAL